jgi:hypothetical protein
MLAVDTTQTHEKLYWFDLGLRRANGTSKTVSAGTSNAYIILTLKHLG